MAKRCLFFGAQVGTLDQLVGLSDDLGRLDAYVESITRKVAVYLGEVLEDQRDKLQENLLANNSEYLWVVKGIIADWLVLSVCGPRFLQCFIREKGLYSVGTARSGERLFGRFFVYFEGVKNRAYSYIKNQAIVENR